MTKHPALPWGGPRDVGIAPADGAAPTPAVFSVDPTQDPEEARREAMRRSKRLREKRRRARRKLEKKAGG